MLSLKDEEVKNKVCWNFQFLLGIQIASIYFHGFKNIHKTRKQERNFLLIEFRKGKISFSFHGLPDVILFAICPLKSNISIRQDEK